mgnify:CR=1 FL=1
MKLGQSEAQEGLEVVLEFMGMVLVVLKWLFLLFPGGGYLRFTSKQASK